MAKKSHCPKPVDAAACAVKAVHGCDAKRAALATMRQVLGAQARSGKVSSTAASKAYEAAARGVATSCRTTEMRKARAAREESDTNRFNGLFGLGILGIL